MFFTFFRQKGARGAGKYRGEDRGKRGEGSACGAGNEDGKSGIGGFVGTRRALSARGDKLPL